MKGVRVTDPLLLRVEAMAEQTNMWLFERRVRVRKFGPNAWRVIPHGDNGHGNPLANPVATSPEDVVRLVHREEGKLLAEMEIVKA